MDSLRALLAASAIFTVTTASLSVGCTRKDMAECVYPMTYQKMKFNLDFPLEMTFKEICSQGKSCMDSFVASCMDKEAQDYWAEWGETLTQRRMDICGSPLKNDITNHLQCWDTHRIKQAAEQCSKIKRFTAHLITSLLPADNMFVSRSSPDQVEKAAINMCGRAKVFHECTWPLLRDCDLKSNDCLPGYVLQALNATATS